MQPVDEIDKDASLTPPYTLWPHESLWLAANKLCWDFYCMDNKLNNISMIYINAVT